MSEKAIGFVELSLFKFCKYKGGELKRRVMVGRVGGRGNGYIVRERSTVF